MISAIIFDLGGVLIDWNPRYLYDKIFDDPQQVDKFLNEICTYEWNSQQDSGRTLQDATDWLVQRHPEHRGEIEAYYERWEEMLNGTIKGTMDILRQLRQRGDYRLLALTNWSHETWPKALELFPFLQWFEGVVVSGVEKIKKPDPRIYQLMLVRYHLQPQRTVFIDDTLPNVETARKLGIHSFHFTTPGQLKKDLAGIAVLV